MMFRLIHFMVSPRLCEASPKVAPDVRCCPYGLDVPLIHHGDTTTDPEDLVAVGLARAARPDLPSLFPEARERAIQLGFLPEANRPVTL